MVDALQCTAGRALVNLCSHSHGYQSLSLVLNRSASPHRNRVALLWFLQPVFCVLFFVVFVFSKGELTKVYYYKF